MELAEAGGRAAPDAVQAARRLGVGWRAGGPGGWDGAGGDVPGGGRDLSRTACVGSE